MPHDDEDEAEHEDETPDEDREETAQAPLPVARRAHVAPEPPSIFGKVPDAATVWGIKRRSETGAWVTMTHPTKDGRTMLQEWPPAELSRDEVEKRWGPGHYRISWWGTTGNGGRRFVTNGRVFEILPPPAPIPQVAAPRNPVLEGLQQTFELQAILDQRAQYQLQTMATLAQLMAGARPQGPDPEVAALRAEVARLTQAQADDRVSRLEAEIARMRSEFVEEPEEPGAVQQAAGVVAKAASRRVFSNRPIGESLQGAFSTWVAEDPIGAAGQIVEVVKQIPSALEAISGLIGKVQQPQAAPPPAQLAPPAPPPKPATPPPPPSPSAFAPPAPAPVKPKAVRLVPPVANGAAPASPPSSIAPTEPPPVQT